jgi:tetratricopeptide (TPR) repeat protein
MRTVGSCCGRFKKNRGKAVPKKDADYYLGQVERLVHSGERQKALTLLEQGIKKYPRVGRLHIQLGDLLLSRNENQKAIAAYLQALDLGEDYYGIFLNLGVAYNRLGQFAEAEKNLRHLLTIAPDHVGAKLNLSTTLKCSSRAEEARQILDDIIREHPDSAEAFNHRGFFYEERGDLVQAIEDYTQALALNPQNSLYWINRGNAHILAGRLSEGIEDYAQALAIDADNPVVHNNLGYALFCNKEYQRAKEHLDLAVRLAPNYFSALQNRGVVYMALGDLEGAVQNFLTAITLEPWNQAPYFNCGRAFQELGRIYDARMVLAKGKELGDKRCADLLASIEESL